MTKEEVFTLDNIYNALKKCCRNVSWKNSVALYKLHPFTFSKKIQDDILNGKYKLSKYKSFTIYEPKERKILATQMRDRVVQRVLCDEIVYKELTKHFIYENGACQINKGTDFAIKLVSKHLHSYYLNHGSKGYVLHLDVRKFFPSTPHKIAKEIISKYIEEDWVKEELYKIVNSFKDDRTQEEIERDEFGMRGIGLGSQFSQLIQLGVLSELDHKIKEIHKIRYYTRYMDDLLIIHESKEKLKELITFVSDELSKLGMTLKSNYRIEDLNKGFEFLKVHYVLEENGKIKRLPDKQNIYRERKKLKKYFHLLKEGKITKDYIDDCFQCWESTNLKFTSKKHLEDMRNYFNNLKERV